MSTQEATASPIDWVNKHVCEYLDTEGKKGGRRSGTLRRTALYYGVDGDRYLVAASDGGSKGHPSWYLNLTADPSVEVQLGPDTFPARARTATESERPRLWNLMAEIFPPYNQYQAKAAREIPVVILERA